MSENNNSTVKLICILDYIGILCLLGLFIEKDDPKVKYHTNQGLILCIVGLVISAVTAVIRVIPVIGWIVGGILGAVCGLAWLVLAILGIVNVINDRQEPLPVIGTLFTILK